MLMFTKLTNIKRPLKHGLEISEGHEKIPAILKGNKKIKIRSPM